MKVLLHKKIFLVLIAIAILMFGGGISYQWITLNKSKVTPSPNEAISTQTMLSQEPTNFQKLYITKNLFIKLPPDTEVKVLLTVGHPPIPTKFLIDMNNSQYILNTGGNLAGLCDMSEYGKTCKYRDEETNQDNIRGVKIGNLRIWQNKNGFFAINPQDIKWDDSYFNNMVISKEKPNTIFTPEEVQQWREILLTMTPIDR